MGLPSSRRHAMLATLLITAVIVHGSLWPYDFLAQPGPVGPFEALLGTWANPPSGRGDLIANILLYMPFGLFGTLAMGGGIGRRFLLVTTLGAALSVSMELLQFYDADRVSCLSDFYLNTMGAAAGAGATLLLGLGAHLPLLERAVNNPVPSLLLLAMLGYRLFPYVPTIDLHKYWVALQPIVAGPPPAADQIFRYFAIWVTASELTAAIFGSGLSLLLQPLLIGFVLAAKVAVVDSVLTWPEVIGAGFALLLWPFLVRFVPRRTTIVAVVLLASIVVERLRPFKFDAAVRDFGWLPFRAFLGGSMVVNTAAFFEKGFLYGSALWLLSRAGLKTWVATSVVAVFLFGTSVAETMIVDRSAEITDTVMVLLIAGLIELVDVRRPEVAGQRSRSG